MTVHVGTTPDSWGVWYANDPAQPPWRQFLDEAAEAGYRTIELGPCGYLSTDTRILSGELSSRGMSVSGAFIMEPFEDAAAIARAEGRIDAWCQLLAQVGAPFLILIDDFYKVGDPSPVNGGVALSEAEWHTLVDTTTSLAEGIRARWGLQAVFHPHAETHVEYQPDVERFLAETQGSSLQLCLDVGHISYRGGDPLSILRRHADRVAYLHLKAVDSNVLETVKTEHLPFTEAVRRGVFCEPQSGILDFHALAATLKETGFDGYGIVEQDMYPADPKVPLPIARRTLAFLRELGFE